MHRKQTDENKGNGIREKIADAVDISKEVVLDAVLVSFIGDRELTLENFQGIS